MARARNSKEEWKAPVVAIIEPVRPMTAKGEFHLVRARTNGENAKCSKRMIQSVQVVVPWEHPKMCQECLIQHSLEDDAERAGTQPVMVQ